MRDEKQSDEELAGKLPDDLNRFAEQLGSFRPRESQIDRDRMLFEAGRAAVQQTPLESTAVLTRTLRRWQFATISSSTVAVSLCVILVMVLADRRSSGLPIAKTMSNPLQSIRSTNPSNSAGETAQSASKEKTFERGGTLRHAEVSTAVSGRPIEVSRIQAKQLALVRSIDFQLNDPERWPERVTSTNGGNRTQPREEPLRSFSLMKGENSQRMIDQLTEESRL
jgi:hypothetical protein